MCKNFYGLLCGNMLLEANLPPAIKSKNANAIKNFVKPSEALRCISVKKSCFLCFFHTIRIVKIKVHAVTRKTKNISRIWILQISFAKLPLALIR